MCVFMWMNMYVCMHVRLYVPIGVVLYARHVRFHVMPFCVYVWACAHLQILFLIANMQTDVH